MLNTDLQPESLLQGANVDLGELQQMPNCNVYEVDKVLNSPTARVLCTRRYHRVICVSRKGLMIVLKRGSNDTCTLKWARECKDIQQVYRLLKGRDSNGLQLAQLTVQFYATSLAKCFSDVFIMEDRVAKDFCLDFGRHMNGGGNVKTLPWGGLHSSSTGTGRRSTSAAYSSSLSPPSYRARSSSTGSRPVVHAVPVEVEASRAEISPMLKAAIAEKRREALEAQRLKYPEGHNSEAIPRQSSTLSPSSFSETTDLITLDDDPFSNLVRSRSQPESSISVYTNEVAEANFVGSSGHQASTEKAEDPFAYLFEKSAPMTSSSEVSDLLPTRTADKPLPKFGEPVQRRHTVTDALDRQRAASNSVAEEEHKQLLSRNSLSTMQELDVFKDMMRKV
ncbi:hypothetical protein CYMTET_6703 [Cymbomonas tetramitiformis]|uniref:Uncharacterized protein n=1 Tax=Cymbomonas tetramitiformis TaxID=36881 RepID=A0AAE0GX29_9CHLO|nr:hypothetical protein CYMTET_6703 [Cymbomonas tetramitiformis]